MRIAAMLVLLAGGLGSLWVAAYTPARGSLVPLVGISAASSMLLVLFVLVLWTIAQKALETPKVTATIHPTTNPGNPYQPPTQHPSEAGDAAKD